jgi:predicted nucleic acid-binding protein
MEAVFDCLARADEALVPAIWPLEVVNSLVVAARQKTISATQSETFVADLDELPVEVDLEGVARIYSSILRISRQHQLSSYDAIYLDLVPVEGLPLPSVDKILRAAAKRSRVGLLKFAKGRSIHQASDAWAHLFGGLFSGSQVPLQ